MNTPARKLLSKIDGDVSGKKVVKDSSHKCIDDVITHLRWLNKRHVKKSYSVEYLASVCFRKEKDFSSEAEFLAFCRINLAVCLKQFENLTSGIYDETTKKISWKALKNNSSIIRDYLHDIRPIAEYIERKKDPTYSFFEGGKNYGVNSFEIFRMSRQLAYQSAFRKEGMHIDHKVSQITSIFCLRQAMEAKFERIIGIHLHNKYGETPKLRHRFHYDFICDNEEHFIFPNTNFKVIKYIYDWCNGVVHKAYQPYVWQIFYSQELVSGLFGGGALKPTGGSSVNGGVRVKENDEMHGKFIDHFIRSYDHGIWCAMEFRQEAVTKYYA